MTYAALAGLLYVLDKAYGRLLETVKLRDDLRTSTVIKRKTVADTKSVQLANEEKSRQLMIKPAGHAAPPLSHPYHQPEPLDHILDSLDDTSFKHRLIERRAIRYVERSANVLRTLEFRIHRVEADLVMRDRKNENKDQ